MVMDGCKRVVKVEEKLGKVEIKRQKVKKCCGRLKNKVGG